MQTGITLRTLRYYDQIGLLTPVDRHEASSARRYSKENLNRLQKIQTLKYAGMSLQEIQEVLSEDSAAGRDFRSSLQAQVEVLRRKIAHEENIIQAIRKVLDPVPGEPPGENPVPDPDRLLEIIQAVQFEQRGVEQYRTAARLQTRRHLYDRFSMNPHGWHRWVFEQLEPRPRATILELGCGDGTLWERNADRIPEDWRITLSDVSSGMIDEALRRIGAERPQFKFLTADAQRIPFHEEQFDLVIANNLLYHVPDLPAAIREIHRVLKPGGLLYASTMSQAHLRELEQLAVSFDPGMHVLDDAIDRFHFGNGEERLFPVFQDVRLLRYEDRLIVTEAEALIDYVVSTPMNARLLLAGTVMEKFRKHVEHALQQNKGVIEMTKENGMFIGRK